MAGSKPLVRQGGRTQQGNISIESVAGLSSELGEKVSDSDPRLSDSREWTASTVTQEEAEMGAASTRRAWTSQRVRQAIAAWYLTVSTSFTRTLLGRSTAAQVRGDLGLGTAATRGVGTASGNVMEVGAFGLGAGNNLRDTVYTTGTPADLFGVGYAVGFTDGSTLSPPIGQAHNYGTLEVKVTYADSTGALAYSRAFTTNGRVFIQRAVNENTWGAWHELISTGNILTTTGQSTEYPMSQKATTDAIDAAVANTSASGPRPVKDHGDVATAGSQTVVCNVQESDFHIMSMETANTTGTLTIDFANMPDTVGKHFSWHVRLRRGGRKTVEFVQPVAWAGGIEPMLSTEAGGYDLMMFYKVNDETIRAMLIDAWQ